MLEPHAAEATAEHTPVFAREPEYVAREMRSPKTGTSESLSHAAEAISSTPLVQEARSNLGPEARTREAVGAIRGVFVAGPLDKSTRT